MVVKLNFNYVTKYCSSLITLNPLLTADLFRMVIQTTHLRLVLQSFDTFS